MELFESQARQYVRAKPGAAVPKPSCVVSYDLGKNTYSENERFTSWFLFSDGSQCVKWPNEPDLIECKE